MTALQYILRTAFLYQVRESIYATPTNLLSLSVERCKTSLVAIYNRFHIIVPFDNVGIHWDRRGWLFASGNQWRRKEKHHKPEIHLYLNVQTTLPAILKLFDIILNGCNDGNSFHSNWRGWLLLAKKEGSS
jgi:hypothetical protein